MGDSNVNLRWWRSIGWKYWGHYSTSESGLWRVIEGSTQYRAEFFATITATGIPYYGDYWVPKLCGAL